MTVESLTVTDAFSQINLLFSSLPVHIKNNVSFEELEHLTLGALRKAVVDGDVAMGTVMAGQIAGMIKKEQTCAEIIQEMVV